PPIKEVFVPNLNVPNINTEHHILFWTKCFGTEVTPSHTILQQARNRIEQCPYSNCVVSANHSRLAQSDGVIFHQCDHSWDDLPAERRPSQYYIFFLLESPVRTWGNLDAIRDFYNLTFTYRLDSDILSDGYFRDFQPTVWNSSSELDQLLRNKTGFAVTFVSNCFSVPSRRDVYTANLAQCVSVDVYGDCGTKQCNISTPEICDRLVMKYKFYLALENSVCKDYVTEKIHRALSNGAVPVVYGGANYFAHFPPHSFINVLDFASPKILADYLVFLSENASAYRKYFEWRMSPVTARLAVDIDEMSRCQLCTIPNTRQPPHKIITDMGKWWHGKEWCEAPQTQHREWLQNPVLPNE
ncbi:alpha-(1,3)-fucosyltransferase C-like, partial [Paramacrobiotus metropolitanus]|uniref:alpha-(1,3)-fucosyltransferase C-like n=1 Tax=Paramacrobiotus metropolitanus TaxID=2943436 RepID=UPI0024460521